MAIGIIFIGESNSEGQAENIHATSAELAASRGAVRMWCEDTNAFASLSIGVNNMGESAGTPTLHGWELEIANMIDLGQFGSLSASDPAYILKVGVGGSKWSQWQNGGTNYNYFTSEYAAYAAVLPTITDLIFFCSIGINDAVSENTSAADHYTYYSDFIDRCRATVSDSTAPFILTHLMPRFYAQYNAQVDALCRNKTNVYRATANRCGLKQGEEHLHWAYNGVKRIANRGITAYLTNATPPAAPAAASAITWTDNLNTTTTGDDLTLTTGTTGGARRDTPLRITSNWVVEWKLDTALKSADVVVCLHGSNDNNYNYTSGNDYLCAIFQSGNNLYSSVIGGTDTNESAVGAYPIWVRFTKEVFSNHVVAQKSSDHSTWTTFKTFTDVLKDRHTDIYVKAFMKGSGATAEVTDATVQDPDYVAYPTGTLTAANTPYDTDGCIAWLAAQNSSRANNDLITLVDSQSNTADWDSVSTGRPTLKTGITPTGKAVYRFNGSANFLRSGSLSALTKGTAFIVVKIAADPPPGGLSGGLWGLGGDTDNSWYTFSGDGGIYDFFGSTVRKTTGNPTLDLSTAFRVYVAKSVAGEWTSRIDGTQHYTTASNAVSFPVTGYVGASGGQWMDGDVADFVLFADDLSTARIQQMEAWLQSMYNTGFAANSTPLFVHNLQQQGMG